MGGMTQNAKQPGAATAVVVNDDVVQGKIIAHILEQHGLIVSSHLGVEEALAMMSRQGPPQLIVTDLFMPGIDGWRFCRLLRSPEYPAFNTIPLVVVSATFSGAEARSIASDLGAHAFMPVPFDPQQWGDLVRTLLAGKTYAPPCSVLIVDDDHAFAEILRDFFATHGYQPVVALTGQSARQLFQAQPSRLVILDHHLPDIGGDELLIEFKRRDPCSVIFMVTGDANCEMAAQFMRQGAAAYARKPVDPDYLVTLCEQALRERALLNIEEILEERTRQLRESEIRYRGLVAELQEALRNVQTLSGLLPICAGCKKIRDDQGYWNQIESYIQKHSQAQFTHSLCPDCLMKYYPDHYLPPDKEVE